MSSKVNENMEVQEAVRETYAKFANANSADTDRGADVEYSCQLGYTEEETKGVPDGANMGLGCGNPVAIAALQPGEVVLDLGSGGGFDCFLAAKKVGPTGFVIGVDMLPIMINKSRLNAERGGYSNVEFRLGEIEALPVGDDSVDVVISNCVINLSSNKPRVFKEIARVLKPGGRLSVSDLVSTRPLPEHIRKDLALHAGCMAGVMTVDDLKQVLGNVGLENINIEVKDASNCFIDKWTTESGAAEYIGAAAIEARYQSVTTDHRCKGKCGT